MFGDWRGTLWTLLVTFFIVIIRCTETYWSPCTAFKRLVLYDGSGKCLLRGTHWVLISKRQVSSLKLRMFLHVPRTVTIEPVLSCENSQGQLMRKREQKEYFYGWSPCDRFLSSVFTSISGSQFHFAPFVIPPHLYASFCDVTSRSDR
jgi:hypothetical protein